MLRRLSLSALVGTGSYVLAVLYGLIAFQPLPLVFWRGVRILAAVTISCFLLLNLAEVLKNNDESSEEGQKLKNPPHKAASHYEQGKEGEEINGRDGEEEAEADGDRAAVNQEDDDFSPLDPPVLETDDEN